MEARDDVLRVALGPAEGELAHPEEEVRDQQVVEELGLPARPAAHGEVGRPQGGLGIRLLEPLAGARSRKRRGRLTGWISGELDPMSFSANAARALPAKGDCLKVHRTGVVRCIEGVEPVPCGAVATSRGSGNLSSARLFSRQTGIRHERNAVRAASGGFTSLSKNQSGAKSRTPDKG